MAPYTAALWSDLFVAAAGASAALAGLVVVAVSINVERILKFEGLPDRALATLILLLGAVVISLIGLAPGQSPTALGAELLVTGLICTATVAILVYRSQLHDEHSRVVPNLLVMTAGTLPFVIGGASLILGAGGGLYWVLAGIVFALVGAVLNAWVLLVEILR